MKRTISVSAICALLAFAPQQGTVTLRLLPPEFAYEARGGGGGDFDERYDLSFAVVDGDLRPTPGCTGESCWEAGESREESRWCLQDKAETGKSGRQGR